MFKFLQSQLNWNILLGILFFFFLKVSVFVLKPGGYFQIRNNQIVRNSFTWCFFFYYLFFSARWQRMAFHYRIPHIPDGFHVTGWFCFCEIKKYSHKQNCGASTWTLWNTARISAWHEGLKRAKQLNSYCFRHNIQYEPGNEYREL